MYAYTLVVQPKEGRPRTLRITSALVRIGRGQGDIALDDTMISSQHGELSFQEGVLTYTDVGSTNGSYDRAGSRISGSVELIAGDVVQLGQTVLTITAIDGRPADISGDRTIVDPNFRWNEGASRGTSGGGSAAAGGSSSAGTSPGQGHAGTGSAHGGASGARPSGPTPGTPNPSGSPHRPSPGADFSSAGPSRSLPPAPDAPVDLLKAGWGEFMRVIGKGSPLPPQPANAIGLPELFKESWAFLLGRIKDAPLVMGVVAVPLAVLWGLVTFVPSLAGLVSLINLIGIPAQMLAAVALSEYVFRWHLGAPVGWMDAWKIALRRPIPALISLFLAGLLAGVGMIALIVPGIALGMFILPSIVAEGRENFALNGRSLQLFVTEPIRLLIFAVAVGFGIGVAVTIVSTVFSVIPAIGGFLAAVLGAGVQVVLVTLAYVMLTRVYFEIRRRHEGGNPEAEVKARLQI